MSPARTGPGPFFESEISASSRACMRIATPFKFKQDVDDVLLHALDARVLVQHALDLGLDDRGAGHRRQQHATQRVAECMTEPALERLDRRPCAIGAERL